MATKIVGIGEIAISSDEKDILKTMALGSCLSVIFHAPTIKTVAIAHVALPDSSIGHAQIEKFPGYFADQAIQYIIEKFKNQGIQNSKEFIIKVVGGASIIDPNGIFNIGKRNIEAIRKSLKKHNLKAHVEDVGENYSRSVLVEVGTGKVLVSSAGKGVWEI